MHEGGGILEASTTNPRLVQALALALKLDRLSLVGVGDRVSVSTCLRLLPRFYLQRQRHRSVPLRTRAPSVKGFSFNRVTLTWMIARSAMQSGCKYIELFSARYSFISPLFFL